MSEEPPGLLLRSPIDDVLFRRTWTVMNGLKVPVTRSIVADLQGQLVHNFGWIGVVLDIE
jgi:hypothetical protein